jgi:hypothetical protein
MRAAGTLVVLQYYIRLSLAVFSRLSSFIIILFSPSPTVITPPWPRKSAGNLDSTPRTPRADWVCWGSKRCTRCRSNTRRNSDPSSANTSCTAESRRKTLALPPRAELAREAQNVVHQAQT